MIDNLMLGSMAIDEDGKQIRTIRELNSRDVETDDRVIYKLIGLSRMEQRKSLLFQMIVTP